MSRLKGAAVGSGHGNNPMVDYVRYWFYGKTPNTIYFLGLQDQNAGPVTQLVELPVCDS